MPRPRRVAGALLACRAFGVFVGVVGVFRIAAKVDARLLIVVGFVALVLPQRLMAQWGPDVNEGSVVWVMLIQGFGSGIPFIGISAMASPPCP